MISSKRRSSPTSSQDELLAAIQQIIPPAHSGVLPLLLAEPPLRAPSPITVTAQKAPFLKPQNAARRNAAQLPPAPITHWQDEHLLAATNSHIAFVIEGVADLEIGVTAQLARREKLDRRQARFVVRLPRGCGVLFPPHIPHSDGLQPHWHPAFGDETGTAFSRIFWIGLLPEGAVCHICCTQGESHLASARSFILARQLMNLSELLVDELRRPSSEIVHLHLAALLLHIERELRSGLAAADESGQRIVAPASRDDTPTRSSQAATLRHALHFIENHLSEPLTADQIARQCYASASHLNRLFRARHGLSLMKFVEHQRVQAAQSLLVNTNLPMAVIGHHVGYIHLPQFSLVFKRVSGLTPSQYRQSHRPQKPVCERR
jgi:AraC-like DNA-binding protein